MLGRVKFNVRLGDWDIARETLRKYVCVCVREREREIDFKKILEPLGQTVGQADGRTDGQTNFTEACIWLLCHL